MYEFKLDTGNNGNLMPFRMYKLLFLQPNINELSKINKLKIMLHV